VKVNIDGIAKDGIAKECLDFSICIYIFHSSRGEYIRSFSSFLRIQKSLYAKVMRAILDIEFAWS